VNPKEIKMNELSDFCKTLAHDAMKDHEKRFTDRMKSVRETSTGLNDAAARLGASVKNAWGTMDKQASEYGTRLVQTLQENALKLAERRDSANFHDTGIFHEDAVKTLNDIIMTVRRYVPKLHKSLKPEMTTLNSSLMKLEKAVKELGVALDGSPGSTLELLQREVDAVQSRQAELLRLRSEEDTERELLQTTSDHENELESTEHELLSSSGFIELGKYEETLRLKEEEIRQIIQPLTKPLLKLERAVAAKQGPSTDIKTLRDLIDSPVDTVVTGQRFANIHLLDVLAETLAAGELEVQDKKRRKAEEAIQVIKRGALDIQRDEYVALQANIQETLRQLRSSGLVERRDSLNRQLSETRSQIVAIKNRQKELQRRIDDSTKTVLKLRNSIESQINEISHKSVSIVTD
jgi:hypothetical protein